MKLAAPKLRSAIAFALMVWSVGAGCMIVSYARAAANHTASMSMNQAMGVSSSMDAHACCKAKHRSGNGTQQASKESSAYSEQYLLSIPSAPTQSGVMNCCPLTSGSMVVGARSQSNDRATVSHEASSSLLLVNSNPPPLAVPLRLPDRAHSYLLGCAFLI